MMKSNITGVIRHLQAFEGALPERVAEVADPKRWQTAMRIEAEQALKSIAEPDEMVFIPLFVATVTGMAISSGMAFEITSPNGEPTGDDVAKSRGLAEQLDKRQYGDRRRVRRQSLEPSPDEASMLEKTRLAILRWVQEEKIKTEVDDGLSDEDIADRIAWIIGVKAGSHRDRTAAMDEAGARLAVHIQRFMEESGETGFMSPETAHTWLLAVLNAWRKKLVRDVPQALSMQIRKAWRQTGERLI